MKSLRSEIGNTLFKYASFVYDGSNPFRKELGDALFKLAAKVSPDKPKKTTKKK